MKRIKSVLALALAVSMLLGSSEVSALAETLVANEPEIIVSDDEVYETVDVSSDDVSSAEEITPQPEEETEDTEETVPEEEEEVVETEISSEDVSTGEETTAVSEEDVSAGEEVFEESTFAGMPEGYVLSDKQVEYASELGATLADISTLEEGVDYVAGKVMLYAQTREEAELAARAYGGTLERYEHTLAIVKLPSNVTVKDAVSASAQSFAAQSSGSIVLPPVYPDYYQYACDYEEEVIEEDEPVLEEDNGDKNGAIDYHDKDPYFSYSDHHDIIGDYYLWDQGITGKDVKVAVFDTGIYTLHEDFDGRIGWVHDYYSGNTAHNPVTDINGHGTHIAGIIAANYKNEKGVAGVAPEAKLYGFAVLDSSQTGTVSNAIIAMEDAITNGMDIVNISEGAYYSVPMYQDVCTRAYKAGITIFAAMGNDQTNAKFYPACYKNVYGVSAITDAGTIAKFSNYSSDADFAFPGVGICSTTIKEQKYIKESGTSQATAIASGVAALILSRFISSGKTYSGKAKVDAIIKTMKKGAVKASDKGTGVGYVYLPTAMGVTTEAKAPSAPTFTKSAKDTYKDYVDVAIVTADYFATEVYYTTDGKKPEYKNGRCTVGQRYTGTVTLQGAKKVTLQAIAVNPRTGVSSKVTKATYKIATVPTKVVITPAGSDCDYQSTKISVVKGKSITLKATVSPSYAYSTKVEWKVTPAYDGVSVNQSGKITVGKKVASGIIFTVTAQTVGASSIGMKTPVYDGYCASYEITVVDKPDYDYISMPSKKTVVKGDTGVKLWTEVRVKENSKASQSVPGFGDHVCYSTSDSNIVRIDRSGEITAVAPGKATITATLRGGSGKKATCTVTVTAPVTYIEIKDQFGKGGSPSHYIAKGKSLNFTATVNSDATNKNVSWSIVPVSGKDYDGITVSKSGKVSVSKSGFGMADVVAIAKDGSEINTRTRIIVLNGKVTSVKGEKSINLFIPGSTIYPNKYEKCKINPVVSYDGTDYGVDNLYQCISSNSSVAEIQGTSLGEYTISALSPGKTTITIRAIDGSGKKATFTVNVLIPASKIVIQPTGGYTYTKTVGGEFKHVPVSVGGKIQFKAKLYAGYGKISNTKVIWKLSNEDDAQYVKIDSKTGKVTALKDSNLHPVTVQAVAADGSGIMGQYGFCVCPKTTKVKVDCIELDPMTRRYKFTATAMDKHTGSEGAKSEHARYRVEVSGKTEIESYNDETNSCTVCFPKPGKYTVKFIILDGSGKTGSYTIKIK